MNKMMMLFVSIFFFSCQRNYSPKPNGYYRIDFPDKEYRLYDSICPLAFEYPAYGKLLPDTRPDSEPCWFNIDFQRYRATIYLSYKEIDNDFDVFIEDNWSMIYQKIAQKADAVDERIYENPETKVFGTLYDISGNAASSVRFFVTDSVKNILLGSLYFAVRPNQDSLAPVIAFFRQDIIHLMESTRWKNKSKN